MRIFPLLFILIAVCLNGSALSETHPFSVQDLVTLDRISNPVVSPDGQVVIFGRRVVDLDANKGVTNLWTVSIDGHNLKQLTKLEKSAHDACWTPDGKSLYFISSQSGSSQIWKIPAEGGETIQVTDLPLDVGNLKVSTDGSLLAFTMEVFPGYSPGQTREQLDRIEAEPSTGRLYDRIFVRHWDTWKDGRRAHIFVMDVQDQKPVDIMKDMDADSPTKPWGGSEEYTFTPDGKSIVFTARDVGRAEPWSVDFDLYVAPIHGQGPIECLTEANTAWDAQPIFSPDGKSLAWLAMKTPGYEADRFRIVLMSWPDGEQRVLTEDWDRSPGVLFWSNNSKNIYATADNLGQRSLFSIHVKLGDVKTIVEKGTVRSPQLAGKKLLFGMDHLQSPVDLYTCNADGNKLKQMTQINAERLAQIRMGEAEQFIFTGWNDENVSCYVVKPVDFDPSLSYPVAFLIHGGPQGSFGNDFHYRWNPQAYTGAGYAAVMVDFHGSTGYGQDFSHSITNDWGGKPLEDLQKGLAAALERYPWMDGDRVAALGASYGGYMINWIAGNWNDRFRCLVNHDGNLDNRMAYFDTEELWFPE